MTDVLAARRSPPRPASAERPEPHLSPRFARARRAEGAAGRHGRRAHRHSGDHRWQGDPHGEHRDRRDAAPARSRAGHVAQGQRGSRPSGRGRGARGPTRVGQLALRGPRRGVPPRRGAADHHLAPDAERGDDAWSVEDGVPGRDRCRVRAGEFLAVQRRVRRRADQRTTRQLALHLEPDGIPPARGVHLCHLAAQLHGHRRQPVGRPRVDGQHGGLEAGGDRRCWPTTTPTSCSGPRACRRA